ncbi:hypothetical protein [Runella slithyformis]|uniref:hypothetical protein n=1 Tax=Runella slithyformis TaxID=106 RepID=UPI0002FC2611|nr:hypothetical protein [Runella slithyformis]
MSIKLDQRGERARDTTQFSRNLPKLLDERMNRLDQRNSKAFEVIEKVLHFYNERLWLRVLVHLGYLIFLL